MPCSGRIWSLIASNSSSLLCAFLTHLEIYRRRVRCIYRPGDLTSPRPPMPAPLLGAPGGRFHIFSHWRADFWGGVVNSRPSPKGSLEPPGHWEAQRPGWPPALPRPGQVSSLSRKREQDVGSPTRTLPSFDQKHASSMQTACRGDRSPGRRTGSEAATFLCRGFKSRQAYRVSGWVSGCFSQRGNMDWGELALFKNSRLICSSQRASAAFL